MDRTGLCESEVYGKGLAEAVKSLACIRAQSHFSPFVVNRRKAAIVPSGPEYWYL
jgi:hypothetical protein